MQQFLFNFNNLSIMILFWFPGDRTLKEQVVPSTPVGGFPLANTPTRTPRRVVTPILHVKTPDINSNNIQSPDVHSNGDTVDAAGDRPRKRVKAENKPETVTHATPKSRPRGERREAVANFRRSPNSVTNNAADSSTTNDFLDLIWPLYIIIKHFRFSSKSYCCAYYNSRVP